MARRVVGGAEGSHCAESPAQTSKGMILEMLPKLRAHQMRALNVPLIPRDPGLALSGELRRSGDIRSRLNLTYLNGLRNFDGFGLQPTNQALAIELA